MLRQWFMRAALLASAALVLTLGLSPLTPSQAAPLMALTASAEPPTRTPASAPDLTPTPDRSAEAKASIDLEISKSASSGAAAPGDRVTFVLRVRCTGRGQVQNVEIVDSLPAGLSIFEATASWGDLSVEGRTLRIRIPVLYAGDEVTIRIVALVEPGAQGALTNRATVTTVDSEQRYTNNEAAAIVSISALSPTPADTPAAAPTAAPLPAALPNTGAARGAAAEGLPLALLGVALAAAGLAARRRG